MSRILLIGLMATVMTGCQSNGVKDTFQSVKESTGGFVSNFTGKDRTEDLESRFIDSVDISVDPDDIDAEEAKKGHEEDLINLRIAGHTVTTIVGVKHYVMNVLDELLKPWGKSSELGIDVVIDPTGDFLARTISHKTIVVSMGLLTQIDSEDELAAMLGHEVSHILLNHKNKDFLQKVAGKAFDIGELYINSGQSDNPEMDYLRLKFAHWAADKTLFPSWNRAQENEADALGVDLIIKAGYNADAMVSFFKKLEVTAQKRKEFVAKNPFVVDESSNAALPSFDMATMINNISKSLEESYGKDYDDAQVRRKTIRKYLRVYYPERDRVQLRSRPLQTVLSKPAVKQYVYRYRYAHKADSFLAEAKLMDAANNGVRALSGPTNADPYVRWVMYQIRDRQNYKAKAIKNLEIAYKSEGASLNIYTALSDYYFSQGEFKKSEKILETARSELGEPAELLPKLIAVKSKLGENPADLKIKCMATANLKLIRRCNDAENG